MKIPVVVCAVLCLVGSAWAEGEFLKGLSPEVFSAIGLEKLTPEELARLEAAVQSYKSGMVTEAQQKAEASVSASLEEAAQKIALAENKAKEAEDRAREAEIRANEAAAKSSPENSIPPNFRGKKLPGWFMALLTLNQVATVPDKAEPLESRLVGSFRGWSGHTVFVLENGTRWVQQNENERYVYSPPLHSPKVKIKPAAIKGFWLQIEGVSMSVRVVPQDLSGEK